MTGFTGFRLRISNTPKAFGLYFPKSWEKLYLEDCIFENISEEAVYFYQTETVSQQTNLVRIYCKNVSVLIHKGEENTSFNVQDAVYVVKDYVYGYVMSDLEEAGHREIAEIEPIKRLPDTLGSDIPPVPSMEKWVSVKKYRAVGDGKADDTAALQKALDEETILYFPQGIYRITDTLTMRKDTVLYGLSPITTQIVIEDDTLSFSGFGTPKPLLETAKGGFAYLNGIGIDTAGKNPRAVGIKWMADETSYMNDIKFVGGHGLMFRDGRNAYAYLYNAGRTADYNPDRVWDYQYSSLWITEGGGGTFKDLWSASPYAEAGITITNTDTQGRMYAISLEHHVRNEIKLHKVKNWSFFAIQTEEEKAEGLRCLPVELVSCENINFANYFLFRVVAVDQPYETGIRVWNCKNVTFSNLHNKAQMQYVFTVSLEDKTTGFYAKSPEYARLVVTGTRDKETEKKCVEGYLLVADGMTFAQGAVLDSKGNLFWCDKTEKRIYRYSKMDDIVTPLLDIHFMPSALAVDSRDYLLVAVDYTELKKTIPGKPFHSHDFTNFHPFFSWFHKRGERVYAVETETPYDSMTELEKVPADGILPETVYRPGELDYAGMFQQAAGMPVKEYYPAPDGKTALEGDN